MKKLVTCLLSVELLSPALAKGPPPAAVPESTPKIIKLPSASYPPIALAARVSGRVELSIKLGSDGTVESVEVVGGPAMLRSAAIESARQMQFECNGCTPGARQFKLSFSYELIGGYFCDAPDKSYPRVSEASGIVTFTGQPSGTCDPVATRVRAAKCLYLWRCGWR
ncbi:exported hypothetical protein [Candidatus Sulfotelmatomonas gaucii]|uniref:TonB C-terminal domain-containing protein n=1 Tax=Candidatus Sulfuritelmatomonas gaucii TaxID=2043161 RepID=A0A2N9LCB1_9BACT|nr:exported hypothetical protein [Candidatus Sulfotelmatomonas gaucii]